MKMKKMTAALLALICASALSACGETIQTSTTDETVIATDTSAVTGTETTAAESATTAVTEAAATATEAADTTAADTSTEAATTAGETTAATEEQTTAAPAEQQTEAPATEAPKEEKHLFDELKIGGNPSAYIAAHTNYQRTEGDSCLGNGKDINYFYPDFKIWSILENGTEKIHEIEFTGPGVSTREGIHVDSTLEEVMNAYGEEESPNYFRKNIADGKIEVFVEHGLVTTVILSAS